MSKIVEDLKNNIVAVIRIEEQNLAKAVTEKVIEAGFKFIELTLSIGNCPELIKELSDKYKNTDVYIGAGTVLNDNDCKIVIDNGATFVVAPFADENTIKYAVKNKVPMLPGIGTVSEANMCYNLGCEIVKAFPGDVLGPNFIKSARAPLPHIKFMPSGGVNLDNVDEWFEKGAYAVSVGSALYSNVTTENLDIITDRAIAYLSKRPKQK